MTDQCQAILAKAPGGPEVLQLAAVPMPVPGPGELLVKIAAVGVNFIESYQREGIYPVPFPFTPGAEAAGTVVAVGPGVRSYEVGDRVATAEGSGCYAEYAIFPAEVSLPVPSSVPLDVAAALPLQGMTAHYLMNSTYHVEPGETVLLHAGAGGVGLLLTQLLKDRGARVITTVSTEEKEELSRVAGADEVLGYDDFAAKVRELTDGVGVDVVYDGVGKDTFDGSLASLRTRGTLVLFGGASGQVPAFDLQRLNAGGSLTVVRPKLGDYLLNAQERLWRSTEVFNAAASGKLVARIGARFPLAEAGASHTALQGRLTTGKVILEP
ncbi:MULTISPECIES: quinone oxidoreductase family protein [Arthrobacter]|uniref:NADPH:quinone reductase n=1 Tax=Arthrobacter psychrochitiniphilus TaxID=291045 RepID=A0A2V3DW44_9MICC|nr:MULTISPECIES: quinone oxidoreductase [Arthrobacter]NYG16900.1 NADPH2:quinone reductase [Arthrobacter psychrochitiniphilus]PXA69598.1 NADPH:quinone reductase [Arthrobacter psychrochitiniphilus]